MLNSEYGVSAYQRYPFSIIQLRPFNFSARWMDLYDAASDGMRRVHVVSLCNVVAGHVAARTAADVFEIRC